MKRGRQYNVRWMDVFSLTNQDEWSSAEPSNQVGTTWGSVYLGKIRFESKDLLAFANTTFPDGTHGDYIYIPTGLIIKVTEVQTVRAGDGT